MKTTASYSSGKISSWAFSWSVAPRAAKSWLRL